MRETKRREGRNRIIIGDSRSMAELEDGSVHLVVTSPPYPMIGMWDALFSEMDPEIGECLRSGDRSDIIRAYKRMHAVLSPTFHECSRVMAEGGICCVNIGDAARSIGKRFKLFPNHSEIIHSLESCGLDMLPYILWKKPTNKPNAFLGSGFLPTNAYVTLDCEYIVIARKDGPRKFEPKDPERYGSSFTKCERDKWFSQIWDDVRGASQTSSGRKDRTAAFPAEVPNRLIRMFSIKGDIVLDPFMGTGTTLVESASLGRKFVGYEINEKALSPKVRAMIGVSAEFFRRSD
jgi:site-specific DNA-methyltransferase (cytosine-N4-specific)